MTIGEILIKKKELEGNVKDAQLNYRERVERLWDYIRHTQGGGECWDSLKEKKYYEDVEMSRLTFRNAVGEYNRFMSSMVTMTANEDEES